MSTFQQGCPSCHRILELPADAKGRLGKCPACAATFTIGEAAKTGEGVVPQGAAAETGLLDTVAELTANKESGSQLAPDGGPVATDQVSSPLAAAGDRLRAPDPAPLEVTECPIEDVLSTTLAIFSARWKAAIVPFLVAILAACLVVVVPLLILAAINDAGFRGLAILGLIILAPFAFVFTVLLSLGMVRAQLAVARNEQLPLSQTSLPTSILLRVLVVSLMLCLTVAIAVVVMFSVVAIVRGAGANVLARILGLLAFGVTTAFVFGLSWQVWSWMFVCGDGKGNAIGSLRAAVAISSQNKLTSFFLILISVVLALLGTLTLLVGHIVTTPLTVLLFAVAYLKMTGQVVADPTEGSPESAVS